MKNFYFFITAFVFISSACLSDFSSTEQTREEESPQTSVVEETTEQAVNFPVREYTTRRTLKVFGQYVQDRFIGYHVADDIEFTDKLDEEIPVSAIYDGVVVKASFVSGYGGLIVLKHEIDGKIIHSLYGHLDLNSVKLKSGDPVKKGEFLGNLGDDHSAETDYERKHLHFALYEGEELRINGYVQTEKAIKDWLNPLEFFEKYGAE